jgi:Gpi18-like mannosyltransferase
MIKVNTKTYIFRISLLLALLLSICTCFYAIQHYQSGNSIVQNNKFNIEGTRPSGMGPSKNSPLQQDLAPNSKINNDQNAQANDNGGIKTQNEVGQPADHKNQQQLNGNTQGDFNYKSKGDNKNRQPGQFGGDMQRGGTSTQYLPTLSIYSAIFLILSCGIYFLFRRKKLEVNLKDEKLLIFTLLAVGLLLRIAVSTLIEGYSGDISLFRNWAEIAANGFSQFYANARQADYPPLYIYVLGLVGKLASISNFNSYYELLLKIPSIIADIITSYFIYKLGKKYLSSVISIFLAVFYIFNPAIFIDSTFWGQVDSFFTLLILIAIYLLCEKKYAFSSAMFATAILMKPQGIIFLPILFFELVRQRKLKNFIYAAISALITALIIIIPFSLNQQNPLWIINLYTKTISEYPYASVNAFNFFSLIGGNYKDYNSELFGANYHIIGMILIVVTTLIGWFVYIKGSDRRYVSAIALLQIAGVFTFSVGMHERYLFPAVALAILAFIYLKDKRFFLLAIGFSITSYMNISTVFFSSGAATFNILLTGTAFLNILLVIYLIKVLLANGVKKFL